MFRIHGHDRSLELLDAINQGTANVVEHNGRITGYTTGISFLGNAVGKSNEDLKALIGAGTEFSGPGFLLLTRNSELFWLEGLKENSNQPWGESSEVLRYLEFLPSHQHTTSVMDGGYLRW